MKIYTRGGDKGRTAIQGKRVSKDDIRIECMGAMDEAVAYIGLLRTKLNKNHTWEPSLKKIQADLMEIMGYMAIPKNIEFKNYDNLPTDGDKFCENWIDQLEATLPTPSEFFLLPGGTEISALCHVVRTQIRKAERRIITLTSEESVEEWILKYINRLSDLFYSLSRADLYNNNINEDRWKLFIKKKV